MPLAPQLELLAETSAFPFVNEFIQHPDFTQIAAFFSGWVFISSVLSIARSPTIRGAVQQFMAYPAPSTIFPMTTDDDTRKFDLRHLHKDGGRDHDHFLILLLFTCFALSSIAYFSSLLTYNAGVSSFVCAFVIASGGVFAGCARVFGMVTLVLELWRLGANMKEMFVMAAWILAAVALMITEYSTSIGTTGFLPQLGTYLCYRIRYIPISLASSFASLTFEAYILLRLWWLIPKNLLGLRRRMSALRDTRSLRTSSLIILELLVMIPAVTFVGRLGEFVPFAIGSLLVLVTFNQPVTHQAMSPDIPRLSSSDLTTSSRPQQTLDALPRPFHHAHGHSKHGNPGVQTSLPPRPAASSGSLSNFETRPPGAGKAHIAQDSLCPNDAPPPRNERFLSIVVSPPATSAPPPGPTMSIREVAGKGQRKNRIIDHAEVYAEVEKALCNGLPVPPPLKIHIPTVAHPHRDAPKRHSSSSALGGSDIIRRGASNRTDAPHSSVYSSSRSVTEVSATALTHSWTSLVWSPASNNPLPSPKQPNRWLMFGGNSSSPTRRMTFTDLSIASAGDRTTFGGRQPPAYDDLVARMSSIPKETITGDKMDTLAVETWQRSFEINLARHRRYRELLRTRLRGPRPLLKPVPTEN